MQNKKIANKIIFEEMIEKNSYVESMHILFETKPNLLKEYVDEYFFHILREIKEYYSTTRENDNYNFDVFNLLISNVTDENHKQVVFIIKSLIDDLRFLKDTKEDYKTKYDFIDKIDNLFHKARIYEDLNHQFEYLRSRVNYLESKLP